MSAVDINPIIPGFSPDPSVVSVDGHFFLVTSTFHLFPGLPIYESTDLVSWRQIGNAFNRREQMSLHRSETNLVPIETGETMLATGGLYAPTIRYKDGTFFVICTNVIHPGGRAPDETENFVLWTTDIWSSKWSEPVWFDFKGIDPSIFFDDDGKAYVTGSHSPGPWTKIHLFELDLMSGKKLTEEKKIWDGTGGIYPEGPHIYKRGETYYLLISEGGTHEDHMITVARSCNIWGPYEANVQNPILTARGTAEYIRYTGHCDMFEDQAGNSWGVCLGVRKDSDARFIMGRETFITPGRWQDNGWPALDLVKSNPKGLKAANMTSTWTAESLVDLLYIRDADMSRYDIASSAAKIVLTPAKADLSAPSESPTFVGRRQRQLNGSATVSMRLPKGDLQAGLVCYKDEHRYLRVCFDSQAQNVVFECVNNAKGIRRLSTREVQLLENSTIEFKIEYTEKAYQLHVKAENEGWTKAGETDTLDLTGPDFVGPVVGVFAVSSEEGLRVEFEDLHVD